MVRNGLLNLKEGRELRRIMVEEEGTEFMVMVVVSELSSISLKTVKMRKRSGTENLFSGTKCRVQIYEYITYILRMQRKMRNRCYHCNLENF